MRRAITYAGAVLLKRSLFVVIGIVLVSGGLITAKSLLGTLPTTYAVTPPDSCFSFSGGQISSYYANEGDNPANPACPRAVDIPATIGGTAVTAIGVSAFENKNITTVSIPSSVTTIGINAFKTNQLTNIVIPNSVTTINISAFAQNQLTSVTLPASLTHIDAFAFDSNLLTSVSLPTNLTFIGAYAFSNNKLVAIDLPSGLTTLGAGAFMTNQLATVTIPTGITAIDNQTFNQNQLTSVTLPATITSIGTSAFGDNLLESIALPSSLTSLGDYAFTNNHLTSLTLPDALTTIGDYAFWQNSLTTINISNSVTTIGAWAFGWNYLTSLSIPNSVTSVGDAAFADNNISSLILGSGLTSIGDSTFSSNKLETVTIPASITSIHPAAFGLQTPWGRAVDDASDPAHDLWNGSQGAINTVYANIWLVQLHTSQPTPLANSLISEEWYMGEDYNGDGTTTNVVGGHIINPANIEIRYRTAPGADVTPSEALTGKKADGTPLRNYLASPISAPTIVSPAAPTPSDRQAIDDTLAVFYRKGQAVSLTAPTVAGYQLVSPGSPANVTLVSAANVFTFTYAAVVPNQPPAAQPAPAKRPAVAAPSTASSPSTSPSSQATQPRSQVVFASPVGSANGPNDTPPTDLGELFTNSTLSTDQTQSCHDITTASLLSPTTFDTPDTTATTLGGVTLTVGCQDEGGKGSVSLTFDSTLDNLDDVRVYQPITGGRAIDVTRQVTFRTATVDGKPKTVLSYPLHDGASFDTDGSANRSIASKLYLVRLAKAVMSPHTTSSPSHNNETPWLRYALIASGAIVLLAAATTGMIIRRRRS